VWTAELKVGLQYGVASSVTGPQSLLHWQGSAAGWLLMAGLFVAVLAGCDAVWASWYRQDHAGQGSGHRVWLHLLQRLVCHACQQVQVCAGLCNVNHQGCVMTVARVRFAGTATTPPTQQVAARSDTAYRPCLQCMHPYGAAFWCPSGLSTHVPWGLTGRRPGPPPQQHS
jgi:hypothetical protein